MSTIIDLNTARTITYNDEANYAIVFGANAGNTTANVDAYGTANITKQTALTSVTSPVRDLLLDVQFSNVGNVSMAYAGTYSNIGLIQIAPAAWRVNGIRSVAQYNEAFANVKYTDLTGASNITPEYSYVTTVNDQAGNTRAWTTVVNVIQQPSVSITGNVIYNEDTLANVTIANVVVDPTSVVTFRLYANTIPTYGSMTDGVVTGNSIFIDGNATSLNAQIAANAIKFLPASDLASNVGNAINFAIGNTTAIFNTANANIQIANTHAEYSFPGGTFVEDTKLAFGNTITDIDTHALSFTVGIQQTAGNIGQFYVSNSLVGYANTRLNITNSKAAINGTIEWLPPADYTGNVDFTYNQSKALATGNVTQASNVVATFTSSNSNPEVSNMIARSYTSNTVNNIFAATTPYLNDGPDYGQNYTITLTSPIGKFGNSAANAIAAASYSYTGNTTLVNDEFTNMKFVPNYGAFAGNSTFTYTQVRSGVTQVNTNLALTGTESTLSSVVKTYTTATADKTLTPTFAQSYWQRANILLVAGGGGGAGDSTISARGQGGGGAGRVVTLTNIQLPQELITITIGAGGDGNVDGNGNTGGSTAYSHSSGGVSVGGGGGGYSLHYFNNDGGTSGNSFTGGVGTVGGGGGGGGSSGVGANGPSSGSVRAAGGPGTYSTISGANVVYGNGGGGGNVSTQGVTSTTYGGGGGGGSQLGDGLPGTAGIVIIKFS